MLVTFWGTRGSISTPGRSTEKYGGHTPCIFVEHGDTKIIFDAGTGIRNLGLHLTDLLERSQKLPPLHLFLSHTHWDHIQGLPFFQPAYLKEVVLTIYGSPMKERFLGAVLKGQMDVEYFPVALSALAAQLSIQEMSEERMELGDVLVEWQEQVLHPGGSVRYRLTVGDKRVVYATDVELDRLVDGSAGGDCRALLDDYLRFVENADLLIADGQYTAQEYAEKAGWGHTSIPVLTSLAERAGVKQLAVFHHDPQHSDRMLDSLWKELRKAGPDKGATQVFWAREGMTLAV
ncbi:MAG: MBL fold metallo-hydrolase [Deltaproteobacteria bacterium]|nr:MBL fold metallo-hydrolase [Deltaproteobacteria bacterium]MBW2102316.1 MBL fold metallo-hydrolase [Deltaproteobacteria bacterium]MBW2349120.1 MBL fold metallo-hydrolase [Deltaproteobacteria bacterium]